jgi:tetratricopeptide (TPR) repeat protein
MALVRDHPGSAVSNYEAGSAVGNVLVSNPEFVATDYERAKTYLERSASLDRNNVNAQFSLILLNASTGHPIDEALLEDMTARLSTVTFNFKFVEALRQLVGWAGAGMPIPESIVSRLYEAALSNETLPASSRAIMLSFLSKYRYTVVGDVQEAVSLALAAVEADPTQPGVRLSLAELAIRLGNYELAESTLEAAEREDRLGRWALQRQALSESLRQKRTASSDAAADVALR